MSCNSIFGSFLSEDRWDKEMQITFVESHEIHREAPNCVFQVATSLRETKAEAYTPQLIGLGPYHHLRPNLYAATQEQKLDAIRYLGGSNKRDIVKVSEAVSKLVPTIRYCYKEYLDLFPKTLAWILTIDGLFLFHYLERVLRFSTGVGNPWEDFSEMGKMAGDIILLENQIPTQLLREIGLSHRGCLVDAALEVHRGYVDFVLNGGFLAFCQIYSPLKLSGEWEHIRKMANQPHLLHLMYELIVNNRGITEVLCSANRDFSTILKSETLYDIEPPCEVENVDVHSMLQCVFPRSYTTRGRLAAVKDRSLAHLLHHMNRVINPTASDQVSNETLSGSSIAAVAETLGHINTIAGGLNLAFNLPGASTAMTFLSPLLQLPWDRISSMFQEEQCPLVEEIGLPTVADMTQILGMKFTPTTGGIKDIKFDDKENTFFLPVITMNTHSETILRNLVAYEAAIAESARSPPILAEYVGLISGIIHTNKDVEILKEAKIVEGELGHNEIAAIFNDMRKTTTTMAKGVHERLSKVEKAIAEAKRLRDNVWTVKIKRSLAECGGCCWKYMRMAITIVVVVVLVAQAFCTVFSCPRWSGESRKLKLLVHS